MSMWAVCYSLYKVPALTNINFQSFENMSDICDTALWQQVSCQTQYVINAPALTSVLKEGDNTQ